METVKQGDRMPVIEHEPIRVELTFDQIGDLIYQQLEDDVGDADDVHARHAIDFAVKALDGLGLIVRADAR